MEDAAAALERLRAFARRGSWVGAQPGGDWLDRFTAAMDDDFNTPDALAVAFEAVKEGNRRLDAGEEAGGLGAAFGTMMMVLGIDLESGSDEDLIELIAPIGVDFGVSGESAGAILEGLLSRRDDARAGRDWATSDAIRDALAGVGVIVEDTADGSRWHRE